MPNGKVVIMGGTQGVGAGSANNPFWELYDPRDNSLKQYAMRAQYLDNAMQVCVRCVRYIRRCLRQGISSVPYMAIHLLKVIYFLR